LPSNRQCGCANAYKRWTPRLVKAAYNCQFIGKDLGAYARNPRYALQILCDSLESLAAKVPVDLAKMKRPCVRALLPLFAQGLEDVVAADHARQAAVA
jgi:hypothetical protein